MKACYVKNIESFSSIPQPNFSPTFLHSYPQPVFQRSLLRACRQQLAVPPFSVGRSVGSTSVPDLTQPYSTNDHHQNQHNNKDHLIRICNWKTHSLLTFWKQIARAVCFELENILGSAKEAVIHFHAWYEDGKRPLSIPNILLGSHRHRSAMEWDAFFYRASD